MHDGDLAGHRERRDDQEEPGAPWQRPQAIMLTFCALHMRGRPEAVYSRSLVDVLARLGVGEHAARSTLARMARRGLLARYRRGKRVDFGLTEHAEAVLQAGERRRARHDAAPHDLAARRRTDRQRAARPGRRGTGTSPLTVARAGVPVSRPSGRAAVPRCP